MKDSKILKSSEKRTPPNAGKGRKKGVPNKITKTVKESIEAAFQEVGGPEYLVSQAEKNPQAFMSLLGRLLPSGSALNVAVGVSVEGERQSFEQILEKAVYIDGGFPDFEAEKARQIGAAYLAYQRGEKLPDPLVVGGLPDNLFEVEGYLLTTETPIPDGVTISGGDGHGFIVAPKQAETVEAWERTVQEYQTPKE